MSFGNDNTDFSILNGGLYLKPDGEGMDRGLLKTISEIILADAYFLPYDIVFDKEGIRALLSPLVSKIQERSQEYVELMSDEGESAKALLFALGKQHYMVKNKAGDTIELRSAGGTEGVAEYRYLFIADSNGEELDTLTPWDDPELFIEPARRFGWKGSLAGLSKQVRPYVDTSLGEISNITSVIQNLEDDLRETTDWQENPETGNEFRVTRLRWSKMVDTARLLYELPMRFTVTGKVTGDPEIPIEYRGGISGSFSPSKFSLRNTIGFGFALNFDNTWNQLSAHLSHEVSHAFESVMEWTTSHEQMKDIYRETGVRRYRRPDWEERPEEIRAQAMKILYAVYKNNMSWEQVANLPFAKQMPEALQLAKEIAIQRGEEYPESILAFKMASIIINQSDVYPFNSYTDSFLEAIPCFYIDSEDFLYKIYCASSHYAAGKVFYKVNNLDPRGSDYPKEGILPHDSWGFFIKGEFYSIIEAEEFGLVDSMQVGRFDINEMKLKEWSEVFETMLA